MQNIIEIKPARGFRRWLYLYAIIWIPIAGAYIAIFLFIPQISAAKLTTSVFSNVIFPFFFGLAIYGVILRWLVREKFWVQVIAHIIGSLAFTLLWANALFRALQVFNGLLFGDWSFAGFTGAALLWQSFQGVTLYYMIAAGTYALWFYDQLQEARMKNVKPQESAEQAHETNILTRFFARAGDDILPVDFKDVTSIRGADDYAEISTPDGKRLARLTLKELEARLDPAKFIRVHRSYIINIDKVASIEPAGGARLSVHMLGGETILASRTGTQKLRKQVI